MIIILKLVCLNGRATGGCSIFVKKGIPHEVLELDTELQAVAVKVSLHKTIIVCDVYIPPRFNIAQSEWADENGFKFSKTKIVCMHFCNKRKLHPDPTLTIYNSQIPVVSQTKFLGVIFDSKLNFKAHIDYIRQKCEKAMNLLKVVAKMDWGADSVLMRLYCPFVRSRLEYGCAVFGSALKSYLTKLEPIQNQGLRICL